MIIAFKFCLIVWLLITSIKSFESPDQTTKKQKKPTIFKKDPDAKCDVVQLIESRGFQAETYYVTTDDGYILTLHRVVNGNSTSGRPFILQHGFQTSSVHYLINSPGIGNENSNTYYRNLSVSNNLGFAMSMFGYDVWLTNSRGNIYGSNHSTLNPKDKKFWEFSTDEMVKYDLPAVIKYILTVTKRKTLGYIGHSQGTRIMFCLLSENNEFTNIVKPFIALAPVARVDHIRVLTSILTPSNAKLLRLIGGPLLSKKIVKRVFKNMCRVRQIEHHIFAKALFSIFGRNKKQLNETRMHVYMAHTPAGSSMWNFVQYIQNYNSKSIAKFDYGTKKNIKVYNASEPPVYDLTKITSTDICLISGSNDLISTPEDLQWLREQLGGKLMCDVVVEDSEWSHADFMFGLESAKYVNVIILEKIAPYDNLL